MAASVNSLLSDSRQFTTSRPDVLSLKSVTDQNRSSLINQSFDSVYSTPASPPEYLQQYSHVNSVCQSMLITKQSLPLSQSLCLINCLQRAFVAGKVLNQKQAWQHRRHHKPLSVQTKDTCRDSGIELDISCCTSSLVSPEARILSPMAPTQTSTPNIHMTSTITSPTSTTSAKRLYPFSSLMPLYPMVDATDVYLDQGQQDNTLSRRLLKNRVTETRYVTSVFEYNTRRAKSCDSLLSDLNTELQDWMESAGMQLTIAAEMHWSFPAKHRSRRLETLMKETLFRALRANNRRVLDLANPRHKSSDDYLPLTFPEPKTRECSGEDGKLEAYTGVWSRSYESLLPHQHRQTGKIHDAVWSLQRGKTIEPRPASFLFGHKRRREELRQMALVAINLVVIKLKPNIIVNVAHI